jgi:hypothetical protein
MNVAAERAARAMNVAAERAGDRAHTQAIA